MKKLIAILLVLGFTMPAMGDVGENKDDNVECEEIFQGASAKNVATEGPETEPKGDQKQRQK
ncbi:hypothetical protein [Halobacteriovorax sp.]|uniref:hypothetical protein n=1 Tax=Halobacteriovorax sp. TaxID=2020862 RepID=UPI0035673F45